jgi:hypothetical protein
MSNPLDYVVPRCFQLLTGDLKTTFRPSDAETYGGVALTLQKRTKKSIPPLKFSKNIGKRLGQVIGLVVTGSVMSHVFGPMLKNIPHVNVSQLGESVLTHVEPVIPSVLHKKGAVNKKPTDWSTAFAEVFSRQSTFLNDPNVKGPSFKVGWPTLPNILNGVGLPNWSSKAELTPCQVPPELVNSLPEKKALLLPNKACILINANSNSYLVESHENNSLRAKAVLNGKPFEVVSEETGGFFGLGNNMRQTKMYPSSPEDQISYKLGPLKWTTPAPPTVHERPLFKSE